MTIRDSQAASKGDAYALAIAAARAAVGGAGSFSTLTVSGDATIGGQALIDGGDLTLNDANLFLTNTSDKIRFGAADATGVLVRRTGSAALNIVAGDASSPVVVTVVGQVATSDGSTSAPAFRGTDADTGVYFPAANQLGLAAGGVSMLANVSTSQLNIGPGAESGTGTGSVNLAGNVLGGAGAFVQDHSVTGSVGTTSDVGGVHTNTGASGDIAITLPSAAALYTYTFVVTANHYLRVNAAAGDVIRLNASASATAGYVRSTTVGNSITLVAVDATTWFATSIVGTVAGTWTIDT